MCLPVACFPMGRTPLLGHHGQGGNSDGELAVVGEGKKRNQGVGGASAWEADQVIFRLLGRC